MTRSLIICTVLVCVFIGSMIFLSRLLDSRVEKLVKVRGDEATTGLALADIQNVRNSLDSHTIDIARLKRTLPNEADVFPLLRATAAKHNVVATFNPSQSFTGATGQTANQVPILLSVEAANRTNWLAFVDGLEQEDYTVAISDVQLTTDSVTNKTSGTLSMVFYIK